MPNTYDSPRPDETRINQRTACLSSWLLMLAICFTTQVGYAQELTPKDYIYPIEREGSGYSGPGMDWILNNVTDKQFLLFGEPHGVEDVPRLVEDIYSRLQPNGFKHLILEIDATTGQQLSELPLTDFISRYPHNIAFDYDGELQLMEKVQSSYPGEQVIWGMDQMVTAIHAFQILEGVAKKPQTRRVCRGLHMKAALNAGSYIREENFTDLDKLEVLFEKEKNQEGLSIVNQIRTSMEIYAAYFAATRGEIGYQFSSGKREEYMKQWFDDFVGKAKRGDELPKAIIKMGGAHTAYGIGPNGVLTLGDHIDKLASKTGGSILSLGLAYTPEDAEFPPKEIFEGKAAILIDHRVLRDQMDSVGLSAFPDGFVQRLRYFDASIYLNNPVRSARTLISIEDQKFKNGVIARLVPYGILVLLNLSLLFPLMRWLALRVFKPDTLRFNMSYHVVLFALSIVLDLFLVAQILSILMDIPVTMPSVMTPGLSFFIFLTLLLFSCSVFLLVKRANTKAIWSKGATRHYRLVAIGNVLLVLYMYYWNMGGMLA